MADPGLKLELEISKFNAMLADLAAIDPRIEFADVVRSEAGSVMAGAMGRTKAASIEKINARAAARKFITLGGKTYYLENRYPDDLYREVANKNALARQHKLNARGISRQSFLHVGKSFGKPARAPAYVVSANYKGQQYPQDGSSTQYGTADGFSLEVVNSSPVVQKANGRWALLGVISARSRYFERNCAHHAFRTLATRARKYPGIFTDPVPPPASPITMTFDVPEGMFGG